MFDRTGPPPGGGRLPGIHFFLYPVVGVTGCVLIGYLGSFILPGQPKTDGLTAFTKSP